MSDIKVRRDENGLIVGTSNWGMAGPSRYLSWGKWARDTRRRLWARLLCLLYGHDWRRWRVEDEGGEIDDWHDAEPHESWAWRGCIRHCGIHEQRLSEEDVPESWPSPDD